MPPAICIRCLKSGCVSYSLDDERRFNCFKCGAQFETQDVRQALADLHAAWDERLKWFDQHPGQKPE